MLTGRNQFTGCTFSDNESANNGSAIMQYTAASATLKLVNTTISGNRAIGQSAVSAYSFGNGTLNLEIVNSTIANNSGNGVGGIYVLTQGPEDALASVNFRNTILSNNSAPNVATAIVGGGPITITSLGFNLVDEDTGDISARQLTLWALTPGSAHSPTTAARPKATR